MNFPKLFVSFCAVLLILSYTGYARMAAQAPTDEWRRPGLDPMVAEPEQSASILPNPAGIKSQEGRHRLGDSKKGTGKKHDWILDLFTLDISITKDMQKLVEDPNLIGNAFQKQTSYLERIGNILSGEKFFGDETGLELLQNLSQDSYDKLKVGTGLPPNKLPADLTLSDLQGLDLEQLAANLDGASDAILGSFATTLEDFVYNVGDVGGEYFSRFLSFAYTNDQNALAWGFSFSFDQKFLYRRSDVLSIPIEFSVRDSTFKSNLPLSFQVYFAIPIRVALAHEFGLPGFTFGLGLKAVPYGGFNQNDLGHLISDYLQEHNNESLDFVELLDDSRRFAGLNLGIDLGVQYHFGAITPKLEFLHTGLKVSDLVGLNIPFSDRADPVRYAIDFDWGVYAEQQLAKPIQVFGGAELIQIRGMIQANPYSALIDPIDHLRLLAGIGLFNNVLRISLQYYNNTLSPSIMLNAGVFQMNIAANIGLSESQSSGFTLGFRLRGPHNGFNKKAPYQTYAQKKSDGIAKQQQLQRSEENRNTIDNAEEVDSAIDPNTAEATKAEATNAEAIAEQEAKIAAAEEAAAKPEDSANSGNPEGLVPNVQ